MTDNQIEKAQYIVDRYYTEMVDEHFSVNKKVIKVFISESPMEACIVLSGFTCIVVTGKFAHELNSTKNAVNL